VAFRRRSAARVLLPPLAAAQFDRVGGLRRAGVLQRDPAPALVAAAPPPDHLRVGARRRQDARRRLRSSIILQSINDVVGIDILHNKLRYMRRYDVPVVRASTFALPIGDETVRLCHLLAGDRAYSLRRRDLHRAAAGAAARRPAHPRHPRLRDDRLAHHRAALRVLRGRAATRTSTSRTTPVTA